jgi:hypothetical protein
LPQYGQSIIIINEWSGIFCSNAIVSLTVISGTAPLK